ncbi:MAG: RNA chaperone Hfq [Halanaerobiaceae bacterium]
MSSQINLQDKILNIVRRKNISVTVYLTNGFQIKGKVIGFDNFTVIINSDNKNQLIYKHAISTIVPEERIEGFLSNKSEKKKN